MITIISVGKKHEDWALAGIERYQKRLKAPFNIEWVLLPHSSREDLAARQEESERILSRLKERDFVVLLDETGFMYDSPSLGEQFETVFSKVPNVVLIIGGAYGVNDTLKSRANVVWSLSKLVFPHQLVRLILVEQLYRAQEITRGGQYHHE
jgi:23S rRNA (pseudouridine1915-N3)-methyltransferase